MSPCCFIALSTFDIKLILNFCYIVDVKCYIIMALIFFLITNEHLSIRLSHSFSSPVMLKLMSLAHIAIVIVVFSLLIFIHNGCCIFVGYIYCKYLFPICSSSFSFMISFAEVKFLIFI